MSVGYSDKPCTKCGRTSPEVDFYFVDNGRNAGRRVARCRQCTQGKEHVPRKYYGPKRPCTRCGRTPPDAQFYIRKNGYRFSECVACTLAHPNQRARQFKHKHGLKLADLHEMWVQQGGACRICRTPYPDPSTNGSKDRLVVDHCHRSRTIRSLLCQACNHMLGASRDNPDILAAGAAYLQEHIGGPVDQG